MRFGVIVATGGGDWGPVADEILATEAAGLDEVWMVDHLLAPFDGSRPIYEVWTGLTAAAAITKRIRVGSLVNCVSFRNVGVLAKQVATLDHVSGGRVELGLGAGWYEEEYRAFGLEFPTPAARVRAFEETLDALDLLFAGGPADYDGEFITLRGARCEPVPIQRPRPPILIGTAGRIMKGVVGRRADAWNCPAHAIPDLEAHRGAVMEAADGRTVRTTLQIPATVGFDQASADRWLDAAREPLSWMGDIESIGIVGTVDEAVERCLAYRDRGVDGFSCALPRGEARRPVLEALGTVAAAVRAA
jgi:alkanesulfonate monooxygenase SsuD/methylene tetrahydromethanopterin reductase-like flavin-dependent oxidoreductase (luciferase family)